MTNSFIHLKNDLIAGITVAATSIPQSMAYAFVAGLPAIYGLYSSLVPPLIYTLFGTSPHLIVGPVAVISLLVHEGVSNVMNGNNSDVQEYVQIASAMCILTGLFQIFFGLLQFGFVARFFSDPIQNGFNSASAVIIIISQLSHFVGYSVTDSDYQWKVVFELISNLKHTNLWTLLIGVAGIVILVAFKILNSRIKVYQLPGPLVLVVVFSFLSWILDFNKRADVKIVGVIPEGLPPPRIPEINSIHMIVQILPTVVILTFVSFVSSCAIANKFAVNFDYKITPQQELIAFGLAQFVGSFFGSFPISASLSRTAVSVNSGAKTYLSAVFSVVLISVCVLFLTKAIYFLPLSILSSVVIMAVYNLIDVKLVIPLWRSDKLDLFIMLVTFFTTLGIGIFVGLLTGLSLSLVTILYKISIPHLNELGQNSLGEFEVIKKSKDCKPLHKALIVEVESSLFFGNAEEFKGKIFQFEEKHNLVYEEEKVSHIVLDFRGVYFVDSSGIRVLAELFGDFKKRGIVLILCSVQENVHHTLENRGLFNDKSIQTFPSLKDSKSFLNHDNVSVVVENVANDI